MALSRILKHIYHNATDEVIRRGKKIFHSGGVQLVENDPITESATFRVRNDAYYNQYRVKVEHYATGNRISLRCQCPYNMGPVCKHEAAALFQLNDLIESGVFNDVEVAYDQKDTTVRMRQITQHFLKLFSGVAIYQKGKALKEKDGALTILEAAKDTVKAKVKDGTKTFSVILKQNEERYFDTSCNCQEDKHPLCQHKVAVFLKLYDEGGTHYFSSIRDWDAQKNKLLRLYGYSLTDDLSGKFEFSFHEGRLFMRVLNPSIKKIAFSTNEKQPQPTETENQTQQTRYGVVIEKKGTHFPFTSFQLISGETDETGKTLAHKIKRCQPERYIPAAGTTQQDKDLIGALRKITSEEELAKHIKRTAPFGEFLDHLPQKLKEKHPDEDLQTMAWNFYLPRYHKIAQQLEDFPFLYFLEENTAFSRKNLQPVLFSKEKFSLRLTIKRNSRNGAVTLNRTFHTTNDNASLNKASAVINNGLIKVGAKIYTADTVDTIKIMALFDNAVKKIIPEEAWSAFLEDTLLPLSGYAQIDFDEQLIVHEPTKEPEWRLSLQETQDFLILKPLFIYNDLERGWLDNRPIIHAKNGKLHIQERDMAAEQMFLNLLRYIHPDIRESRKAASFLLPAKEAFKGNWYFQFREILAKEKVTIIGYEKLRQLKINPNKPKTRLQIASGIDWFEADISLSFGEETVSLKDVKKALAKKQNFVSLKDGTMGLLTDEWREKYSLMIKMGTLKDGDTLRLKKMHFSALENAGADIEDDDIKSQIAERRAKILSFDYNHPTPITVEGEVKATLRPYQQAGIQWLNFLKETGWGGILADDMGLGKTLQSLAFLQHYLVLHPNAFFLVVCPTTLMYNWESEINKFTPNIKYKIHHGPSRISSEEILQNGCQLVITTYGTLRSDIKMLSKIQFDYVVLDESQAIKNPNSQIARSVLLLHSKNRLALSGTPVQNNTFDLFSQMNFLNPGLLGSVEFFRNEFAIPIDKMQEKEARNNLKKLINPFLLRRTKEQVAPDLPLKTETTIYCEMGSHQKRIYHGFRNSFRTKILQEIDSHGIGRSRISVLTGLMKLRQICDSPAILKGEDEQFENHSVKIQELVRELSENTGSHKALVFSQFLGMLSLIRAELEKLQIPYVYFDGSTPTKEREKAIQAFQNQEECRVFLISLKAGGVGLNLTAADYVYIVDPWWNPTVEQQAIDRTHRIGQTKKIFAYRLICKDTIEEKIIQLQQKKLNLAKELIADENAFVKKLTRDDIAFLLS